VIQLPTRDGLGKVLLPVVLIALGFAGPAILRPLAADNSPQKTAAATVDIFSGTVTQLSEDSLTVVRKVPALDAVTRSFARDAQTKVEGNLRIHARVTVRYESREDGGLIAVRIIVR
jgi:hypothetical protein